MKVANKIIKIIYILSIILIIGMIITKCVYGVSLPSNLSDIYNNSDPTISNIGSQVLWVVQIVLYTAALIILMFAGVKYMMASPEGKAEIKKKMIYLSIGGVLLFAAGGIIKIVSELASNI